MRFGSLLPFPRSAACFLFVFPPLKVLPQHGQPCSLLVAQPGSWFSSGTCLGPLGQFSRQE